MWRRGRAPLGLGLQNPSSALHLISVLQHCSGNHWTLYLWKKGEETTDCISVPVLKRMPRQRTIPANFKGQYHPMLQMKLREPQQLTCPRSQWEGAEQGFEPRPEDPHAFPSLACCLTMTAGSPPLSMTTRSLLRTTAGSLFPTGLILQLSL